MALKGYGKRIIQNGVDNLTPFKMTSVSGKWFDSWADVSTGQLPNPDSYGWKTGKVYVVFSYRTPIAWTYSYQGNDWMIPDVKYSPTTTNHQSVTSVAIANRGFYSDARW